MIVYKVTDDVMQTFRGYQWELNVTKTTDGAGRLCGKGWLHAYPDTLTAAFMCEFHCVYPPRRLFEAEAGETVLHAPFKLGTTELTLKRKLPLPVIPMVVVLRTTITAVLRYGTPRYPTPWHRWAARWLSGVDRSTNRAEGISSRYTSLGAVGCASRAVQHALFDPSSSRAWAGQALHHLETVFDLPALIQEAAEAEGELVCSSTK
jgi:hypothetical protein